MNRTRLSEDEMSLGYALLIVQLTAFATVDVMEMYDWARAQLDALRMEFYLSNEPTENFPLWLRTRYLAREVKP